MISCPKCGSVESYRKVSALYESQTSNIQSRTNAGGVGLSNGGIGVGLGTATTTGQQRSLMAERLAPPPAPPPANTTALIFLGICLLGTGVAFISATWTALGVVALITGAGLLALIPRTTAALAAMRSKYETDIDRWKRQWACERCGEISEPSQPSSPS